MKISRKAKVLSVSFSMVNLMLSCCELRNSKKSRASCSLLKRHYGFVEDIRVTIIDRLIGRDRTRESFWQHKLDTFTPRGLNVKEVDA